MDVCLASGAGQTLLHNTPVHQFCLHVPSERPQPHAQEQMTTLYGYVKEKHTSLEGAVIHVSLDPGSSPSKCIASFAVGPPVLVDFTSDVVKQLPAFIMGEHTSAVCIAWHLSVLVKFFDC